MLYLLAILLPGAAMIVTGRVIQGIICTLLQFTLIGWLPAVIWSFFVINAAKSERQMERLIRAIHAPPAPATVHAA